MLSWLLFRFGLYRHREAAQISQSAWLGTFGGSHPWQVSPRHCPARCWKVRCSHSSASRTCTTRCCGPCTTNSSAASSRSSSRSPFGARAPPSQSGCSQPPPSWCNSPIPTCSSPAQASRGSDRIAIHTASGVLIITGLIGNDRLRPIVGNSTVPSARPPVVSGISVPLSVAVFAGLHTVRSDAAERVTAGHTAAGRRGIHPGAHRRGLSVRLRGRGLARPGQPVRRPAEQP